MNISRFTPPISARRGLHLLSNEVSQKLHGVRIVLLATLFFTFFSLFFASCSKDGDDNHDLRVTSVESAAPTYYAVSENEMITFSSQGIIDVFDQATESPVWVLSYEEIAKRLDIDLSKVNTIKIARDRILDNGLWRFAVSFDGQEKGSEYGIDVNITNGDIEWSQTMTEMPKGIVTLHICF